MDRKKEKEPEKENSRVRAVLSQGVVTTENSDNARLLFDNGRFGSMQGQHVQLSLLEAAYLLEKERIAVFDGRRQLDSEQFLKKAKKLQPNFWIRYCVFRDMRNRGYIIKTALKFGADFRVYEKGVKPGDDHAKWVVYAVSESQMQTWHEFSAKNRVAHSTKKRLMIAVVDDEGDISYWEVRWIRP